VEIDQKFLNVSYINYFNIKQGNRTQQTSPRCAVCYHCMRRLWRPRTMRNAWTAPTANIL